MTKATLLKLLEKYPDHAEVMITATQTEFAYAPVGSVTWKKIPFQESPGGKALAKIPVIILTEE